MNKLLLSLTICLFTASAMAEPICKVVDGDTFHLCNGVKVRLSGIDAPERGEPYYKESKLTLGSLLDQGMGLTLRDCHTDTTGRRQACKVFVGGKDVQAEMVRRGMAWDWPRFSNGRYAKVEGIARQQKIGLWINDDVTNLHWSKRHR